MLLAFGNFVLIDSPFNAKSLNKPLRFFGLLFFTSLKVVVNSVMIYFFLYCSQHLNKQIAVKYIE